MTAERGPEAQVLERGEVLVEPRAVTEEAELTPRPLGVAGGVRAADEDPAARGTHEGGRDPQERRLAGAVGAEQGDRLAASHVEIDPVEDEMARVRLAEAARREEAIGWSPGTSVSGHG